MQRSADDKPCFSKEDFVADLSFGKNAPLITSNLEMISPFRANNLCFYKMEDFSINFNHLGDSIPSFYSGFVSAFKDHFVWIKKSCSSHFGSLFAGGFCFHSLIVTVHVCVFGEVTFLQTTSHWILFF